MKELDLFGSQILFRFNKQPTHNTRFGSFFTLAIVSIIGLRLVLIISSVIQRSNPIVLQQERQVDSPKVFTINQNTFQMAFGMQDSNFNQFIDEEIYKISATNVHKTTTVDPQTGVATDNYEQIDIPITKCSLANFPDPETQKSFQKIDYANMYCFPLDTDLQIGGDFSAESFQYININLQKCTQNCKHDDVIQEKLRYSFFSMQFSDVLIDTTQKSNPFKHYSRDTFFTTSLEMPKNVDFFMRNNYIQSDYGWITSDIETVSYPSYSYADQSVYPTTFQNFFFQIIIRFEKQKENLYTRKYQNLNDIISQIGGFTQSLLAIGFVICSRLSQLDLNKEIINEAFNYENLDFEEERLKKLNQKYQNQMADNQKEIIMSPNGQDHSYENIQKSFLKKKIDTNQPNQKNQISQFFKSDQLSMNQSDVKGMLIKPVSLDPNKIYSNNQSILINGNNNYNIQSHINYSNQFNPNQTLNAKRRSSFRDIINQEVKSNDINYQNGIENTFIKNQNAGAPSQSDSEKLFLQHLIQNQDSKIKSDSPKDIDQYLSPDHYKLKKQQLKLEEKEQKLKESMFKKLIQKATSSMTLNTLEYLKFFLWPFGQKIKQKKKVIDYSIDQLYYHLDVLYVIKKLVEVDKLKNILLNPDQLRLFEYIPKPTIRSNFGFCKKAKDIQFEMDDHYQDNRTELQKAQQAYQAYQNLAQKQNLSKLDVKIIQLLDEKLLTLFGISQNSRDTLIQSQQIVLQNIDNSQTPSPTAAAQNNANNDRIKAESIQISYSNSDEDQDSSAKNQELTTSKIQNEPATNSKEENLNAHSSRTANLISPRCDSQRSIFSEIASNEGELKKNEIHEFENSNPKGQSQLNQ